MQNTKQAQNIKQMLDTKQVENIKKDGNADLEVEEYYKAIFDFLKDSIVIIADITGKIIYCNPNFFDFSGYSPDEIVGKKYTSLPIFSLKDLPRFVKIFFSVIRGEKIYSYQYNWKDKSGEMKISKADIGPIKRDGRVTGIISILKDITEEKTAEEMLKKSEERLSLALEGSGGGIWDWDIKNNRFYLSGNLIEKSGYSLTDVGNSPEVLLEKIYPDDRINFEKTMMEHISGKTSKFVIEVRFIISSGALRWVIIRGKVLLRDYRGKPLRIAGTIFDITDKKATEEALHLSSLSIDNSNEEIFWVDENSNLVNVNKAACRILGYSREELLKMKVPDIDPIYTNEIWPRHWQEVKSGKVKLFESLQITRSGRTFPVEINVNFIQLNGREYIFAFVKDISERKKKELELKKSEQRYRHLIETMYEGVWQIDK
ncbi:MAG: PAS domain S-box protein, partial [Actinobacteria bacterium]|nr:PAS domain S-box protein [Actinomycetota bacterium]